jgi:PAS domain S-box-containing protein
VSAPGLRHASGADVPGQQAVRPSSRRHSHPDYDAYLDGGNCVRAWSAYQDAALGSTPTEFMLVADDDGAYVAASSGVKSCLGYRPDTLIGMHIADLAAAELVETTPAQWAAFLAVGRQDGQFRLRAVDGRIVNLRYQARAHHPVPGYHMSRLWLDDERRVDARPSARIHFSDVEPSG